MSYEGFAQVLCVAGHLHHYDSYEFTMDGAHCFCGEPFVFRHDVDQTNGCLPEDRRTHRFPFVVKTPAEGRRCDMGHFHIVSEVTYQIPSPDEYSAWLNQKEPADAPEHHA